MGKKCLKFVITAFFAIASTASLHAQGAGDVLRYSLQYPSYDPVSVVMPGVSDATGFGTYQQNPAAAALFEESFFSFSLSNRYVNEAGTYLGNTTDFDDNQANVGDIGFVYNVPTARGKLAVGAGYSQSHDFNRALAGSGSNITTTITDFYAGQRLENGTPLAINEAAFSAFAIDDFEDENGDVQSLSILRFLPEGEEYRGISQNFELTERGTLGEFSAFIATEFIENLIVGASIGVINGSYEFERDFLETDSQGNYDDAFIDTDDDGEGDTDIDNILSENRIAQTFSGFSARFGFVYEASPNFNFGASYQFRNVLNIDEEADVFITTTLDNGVIFEGEDLSEFQFKVIRPARFNVGFTAKNLSGLTLSASAERVAYSRGRVEFEELVIDGFDLTELENTANDIVSSDNEDVINFRIGLEYKITDQFIPRIGYAYYPSPTVNLDAERQFFSGGFTARVSEHVDFNLGAQLGLWDDENTLYTSDFGNEFASEEVNHWNVFGGFTFDF